MVYSFLRRGTGEGGADFISLDPVMGHVGTVQSCNIRGVLEWISGSNSVWEWWWKRRTGFLERWSMAQVCQWPRCIWTVSLTNVLWLLVSPEVVRQLDKVFLVGPSQLKIFCSNEYEAGDTIINLLFQTESHATLNLAGLQAVYCF